MTNGVARSTGCKMHDDCLTCPLPKCIYDVGRVNVRAEQRRSEIRQMSGRLSVGEVAEQLSISKRTVQRALKGEA